MATKPRGAEIKPAFALSTDPSWVDGDMAPLRVNPTTGALKTEVTGAGSGGTSAVDGDAFTAGTSAGTPLMGENGTALKIALVNASRALVTQIANSAGTEILTLANPGRAQLVGTSDANVAQINGVTPLMGAGNTGTGSQRVTIATDQATLKVAGPTASGSSLTLAPVTQGGLAKTALPTAVADGQVVDRMHDKYGRGIVLPQAPRDLVGTQTTTISSSASETTVVTAVASVFLDLVLVTVANTSATAVRVDFRDTTAGSVIFSLYAPAGQTVGFAPPIPVPQTTVNTNWTAQSSASVADLRVFLQFVKNR